MFYLKLLFENQFALAGVWLLGFLSVLGLAAELKARSRFSLAASLLVAVLVIVNLLYWGAFLNFRVFQAALYVFGLLCLFRRRAELAEAKSAVLWLLCLVLWFACVSAGSVPFAWDEYFWSLFDKHLSQFPTYWTTSSAILVTHIRYMPGAALWHSFFGVPGHYLEATAYFANSVLLMAIVYWLADSVKKENRVFLLVTVVLAVACFSEGLYTLYLDQFVGLFLGLSLLTGARFLAGEKDYLHLFILSLSASLLFKETGAIPVIAIFITLPLVYVLRLKRQFELRKLLPGLVYCLLIALSWKLYTRHIGGHEVVQLSLLTDFSPEMTAKYTAVLAAFARKMVLNCHMLAVWLLAFLIFKAERKSAGAGPGLLYSGFVLLGFLGVHLLMWLFLVGDIDGRSLAGPFERYMGSLLLALFVYYSWLAACREVLTRKYKSMLCFLLVCVPLVGGVTAPLFRLVTPDLKKVSKAKIKLNELRSKMPEEIYSLCEKTPAKVWFVYQNSKGFEAMMARHLLAPCPVANDRWSIGGKYSAKDLWTRDLSDAEFVEMANKYPVMVTASIDDGFRKRYGRFFAEAPQDRQLYRFEPNKLGGMGIFILNQ